MWSCIHSDVTCYFGAGVNCLHSRYANGDGNIGHK